MSCGKTGNIIPDFEASVHGQEVKSVKRSRTAGLICPVRAAFFIIAGHDFCVANGVFVPKNADLRDWQKSETNKNRGVRRES